ncbi:MAG: shikimate dehydrogenase [Candidatus Marinimicrobia bacterium]|nr:shikimate dehydrogenase [Candidatus Neomarinimicrobiota bacterium]
MNFAVIGNPVAHSLSPDLHNWIFKQLGIDAHYKKIETTRDGIPDIISRLRRGQLNGINVTLPHKQEIIPYLDSVNPRAQLIHVVNCVAIQDKKLTGYNTDWFGFITALEQKKIDVKGKICLILGAGGVARSVLYSLIQYRAQKIILASRIIKKGKTLIKSLSPFFKKTVVISISFNEIEQYISKDCVIINCTPVGMTPDSSVSPLAKQLLQKEQILIDTIYNPINTKFLMDGQALGVKTLGGLTMFIYQGIASLELWLNNAVRENVNINELKEYLQSQIESTQLIEA